MEQVSERVYAETGLTGCNVGAVVTPEGIVLIDSPWHPADALKWKEEIERKGQILYVINTENHFDHVVGNYFLPGVVISTQRTRDSVTMPGKLDAARQLTVDRFPDAAPYFEGYALKAPAITFDGQLSIFLGGTTIHVIALPGHVPGELAVHIPDEGVVFTGDNIVHHAGPAFHEALPMEWLDAIKQIEALGAEVIVPGHGAICDKTYIPEFVGELESCIESVKEAIRRGLTREEAASQVDYLSKYEAYGVNLDEIRRKLQRDGVNRLYDLLTAQG